MTKNEQNKMRFKSLLSLFLVLTMFMLSTSLATAYYDVNSFGSNQYYSVYFDEEGEAAVMAKLTFQNTGQEDLEFVTIEVPGHMNLINALQEVEIEVESETYWRGHYTDYQYYTLVPEEQQLSDSTLLVFELEEPIGEQEEAVLLFYYKVYDYSEEKLGVWNFDFETIKIDTDVNYVRVAVNVVNDLHMKGVEGEIDYQDNYVWAEKSLAMGASEAVMDEDIAEYSRNIEYQYGLVEEAYALDPQESFIVSGKYSNSLLLLHLWRTVLLGIMSLGIVAGLGVGIYKISKVKRDRKRKEIVLLSFTSALFIVFAIASGMWAMDNVWNWVGWQWADIVTLMLGITIFLMCKVAFLLPPIYMGIKHKDLLAGLVTVAATVGFLAVFSVMLVVVMALV